MPKGYAVPFNDPGSVGEQLLGRGDEKRSTKTLIEDGPLAMFLGMVRGLPDQIINVARHLHAEEYGVGFEEVSPEFIMERYPEARELITIHQQIIEHKASQGGFMVDRYTQRPKTGDEMDVKKDRKESSGQIGSVNKRWS